MTSVPLTKLEEDVYIALKLWHRNSTVASPFEYLYLFQKALRDTKHMQQATKTVILDALETLEVNHEQLARLLRLRFLDQTKMHQIATQFNIAEGTAYKQQKQAVRHLATLIHEQESQARRDRQTNLEKRLNLPPQTHLFGITEYLECLLNQLARFGTPPWLISIEGLGGIGKTALASTLIREIAVVGGYRGIAWISAKQQDFFPALGLQSTKQPALDADTLVNGLLMQLYEDTLPPASSTDKLAALTKILKAAPYLVVIDNLETVVDYESLLPTLYKLSNPSRFLLTSRHSLQTHPDFFCVGMKELSQADTHAFLRYEAKVRGIETLANASQVHLNQIYHVVGGNPLALKLVVGQIGVLPLPQVIENLQQAYGKKVDELYTHIYWQAWRALDVTDQQVLLVMPLAQEGDLAQLAAVSNLTVNELNDALEHLVKLSLVDVGGNLVDRYYRIHRLTESFLLNEVTKWQAAS